MKLKVTRPEEQRQSGPFLRHSVVVKGAGALSASIRESVLCIYTLASYRQYFY